MKKDWSKSWKNSTQPRKQRKFRANAPLHVRKKFVSVHLDKSLRKKYGVRSFPLRKGDEIKIMRGGRKNSRAKVADIDLKRQKVYLEGQVVESVSGGKTPIPFKPSNLMLTSINASDKTRENMLSRKSGKKVIMETKQEEKKKEKSESKKSEDKKDKKDSEKKKTDKNESKSKTKKSKEEKK